MVLSLQSNNDSLAGDYYVKIEVTFSLFPLTYINTIETFIRLKKSCKQDKMTMASWALSGSKSIVSSDLVIGKDAVTLAYVPTVLNAFKDYCTIKFFLEEEVTAGVW